MNRTGYTGLLRIDFPGGTVRLTDGGFIVWDSATWASKDATYGALASVSGLSEGVDEQVPALKLVLMPPGTTAAATLSQPGDQKSRVRMYLAEYNADAGTVVGTPDTLFDGWVDRTQLTISRDQRQLQIEVVSSTERLFERNAGSPMSPTFHKNMFAGETGEDNATGLSRNIAWGTENPSTLGNYGFGGGGGGGSSLRNENVNYQ